MITKKGIQEILKYEIHIQLKKPAHGFWDGDAKSKFIFSPSIERSAGAPAIRWGSYEANLWVVIEAKQTTIAKHFAAVKRKLRTSPPSKITIHKTN